MADKKITDLPVLPLGSIVPATDVIPVVNGGITKQVTLADAVIATFDALDPGVASVNGRTGVVTLTSTDVNLANVNNTSDANKPVSTAQQTALDLKANLASPTFTGTVGGITKSMVGLGNADNTSDVNKPVSTAQQTALNLKADSTGIQSQTYTAFLTAGTSTAYTLTPSPAITAYAGYQSFFVDFHTACGAAPTININGKGAIALVKEGGDGVYVGLAAGDITNRHLSRVTLLGSGTSALVEILPFGASSFVGSGYQKFPSGLIIQWGTSTSVGTAAGNASITFPVAFPNAARIASASVTSPGAAGTFTTEVAVGGTTTLTITALSSGAISAGLGLYWMAIGN